MSYVRSEKFEKILANTFAELEFSPIQPPDFILSPAIDKGYHEPFLWKKNTLPLEKIHKNILLNNIHKYWSYLYIYYDTWCREYFIPMYCWTASKTEYNTTRIMIKNERQCLDGFLKLKENIRRFEEYYSIDKYKPHEIDSLSLTTIFNL